ncbi:hypothetical protein Tco_1050460 [Tanacetum coccineum]
MNLMKNFTYKSVLKPLSLTEYDSDSEEEYLVKYHKTTETLVIANQTSTKLLMKTVNNHFTHIQKPKGSNEKSSVVNAVGKREILLISPQQVVIGDHKDTTGTMSPNTMVDPVLETVSLSKILGRPSPNRLGGQQEAHHNVRFKREKVPERQKQVFLDELERVKRQEKDANNAAEALRKEFAQET